jgi:predicted permease
MTSFRPGIRRLFRLHRWSREDAARDLRDEMELHVALRAEQLLRAGMAPGDAEREARRLFAVHDHTITELHETAFDRNRHMLMRERWEAVWQDTRYAARRLVRDRATTAFMLATLALGIGVNVSAFSVADHVLLRGPQHVRDADRLVRFYSRVTQSSMGIMTSPWLPYSTYTALRANLRSTLGVGAYRESDAMIGRGATSETRRISLMSTEMFDLLGVHPVRGRFFNAFEDADNVAVIGERYWRTSLGADPDILGKPIVVDDIARTIVGIAPDGFTGAELRRVDVWTPIGLQARNSMNMEIVARLKPGASIDDVVRGMTLARPQIEATLPRWAGWLRRAEYLAAPISYDAKAHEAFEAVMARWLAAISAIILIASCANVANLLLARLARRRRELAVRVALGSGRARVMRLLALEGILVALGAAVLALAVAALIEPVVQSALFPDGSWAFSLVDMRVVGAVAIFALFTCALVAIVPSVQAARGDMTETLRGGNQGGESRSVLRSGLTILQATLSVMLLVGAGLFLRSLARVNATDLGMDPDRVLAVELRYPRDAKQPSESMAQWGDRLATTDRARHHALIDVARRVPGVEKAAVAIGVPFFEGVSEPIWVPGRDSIPALPGGGPSISAVGTDYFATMGTAIRRGRAFLATDGAGTEPVVIVNETMARALWPTDDPLTKCVMIGERTAPCARIVGVASDLHRTGLKEEPSMQYYVPLGQERGFSGSWLLVRPQGDASPAWPALREALEKADPAIRSIDVRLLSQGLDAEMRPLRLGMVAFSLSAALALVVAGLGLYSIMAHTVAWRRHEIGVRLALGARPHSIATLIVGRGALLATIGMVAGLIIALAARHWIEPQLFNTSATDPLVFGAVIVVLELMALLAGWLPARRAMSVSPLEALRME